MRAEVVVEGGRRWGSVYRVGDLMGGQTREGNASPWVVCQAMVNGSQMSKLGFEHQALVRMHKNSVDVHSDYLPPTNRVPMHTCLLLDPSILVKCVDLGSLAIQPGEPPPLPHKYMGDGGSPNSSPPPVPDLLTSVLQPSTSGGHLRSQQTTGRIRAAQGMASTASHAATTVTSRGVGIDCPDAVWRAPVYDDTTISAIDHTFSSRRPIRPPSWMQGACCRVVRLPYQATPEPLTLHPR